METMITSRRFYTHPANGVTYRMADVWFGTPEAMDQIGMIALDTRTGRVAALLDYDTTATPEMVPTEADAIGVLVHTHLTRTGRLNHVTV